MADHLVLVNGLPGAGKSTLAADLAPALPGLVVVESWWFRPRDLGYVRAGLDRCSATAVVEIWCDVPSALARLVLRALDRT